VKLADDTNAGALRIVLKQHEKIAGSVEGGEVTNVLLDSVLQIILDDDHSFRNLLREIKNRFRCNWKRLIDYEFPGCGNVLYDTIAA
jgi:predicted ATP-dependent serine protease